MTDEEKKAIEMIEHIQECNTLIGYRVEDRTILAKALLNLIEKQSKEIEELKEDNEHQWEERCKLTIELENSTSNDKIEAIIEEYDETLYYAETEEGMSELKDYEYDEAKYGKKILQSLLEKE